MSDLWRTTARVMLPVNLLNLAGTGYVIQDTWTNETKVFSDHRESVLATMATSGSIGEILGVADRTPEAAPRPPRRDAYQIELVVPASAWSSDDGRAGLLKTLVINVEPTQGRLWPLTG